VRLGERWQPSNDELPAVVYFARDSGQPGTQPGAIFERKRWAIDDPADAFLARAPYVTGFHGDAWKAHEAHLPGVTIVEWGSLGSVAIAIASGGCAPSVV
jgi:hypothetical protein